MGWLISYSCSPLNGCGWEVGNNCPALSILDVFLCLLLEKNIIFHRYNITLDICSLQMWNQIKYIHLLATLIFLCSLPMLISVFFWRIAACSSTGIYIGDKFYGRFMLTPFVLSRSFHATGYYTWFTHHNYFCNHKGQLNIYGCFCQVTVVQNTRTTTKFLVFLRMHRRMTSRRHFILWVSLQFSWSWDIPRLAHDWTIYLRWACCESNIHWSSGNLTCFLSFHTIMCDAVHFWRRHCMCDSSLVV